jgi:hypothetical protein
MYNSNNNNNKNTSPFILYYYHHALRTLERAEATFSRRSLYFHCTSRTDIHIHMREWFNNNNVITVTLPGALGVPEHRRMTNRLR